ncbi:unnamed protein product [Protopolystoma xenopodis]|uniref:Uncharacterized protein n=1 Tax=Protopolystoma xenopodis TaxID=117903 RepID=A0A448WN12_9PLAT|nr:unnamed protein product [Protopolystoma xenopodis]
MTGLSFSHDMFACLDGQNMPSLLLGLSGGSADIGPSNQASWLTGLSGSTAASVWGAGGGFSGLIGTGTPQLVAAAGSCLHWQTRCALNASKNFAISELNLKSAEISHSEPPITDSRVDFADGPGIGCFYLFKTCVDALLELPVTSSVTPETRNMLVRRHTIVLL